MGGLGQAGATVKEQEARLTSVPRLICSVFQADVLMSDGDGQVEPIWLPQAIQSCFFFQLPIYVINHLNESPFSKSTGIFKSF